MPSDASLFARSWHVGRWTVTVTVPPVQAGRASIAALEWSPGLPERPLTALELEQYRQGRDAAAADLARTLGLNIAVQEIAR
jgi:hypothetical protein